MKKRMNFPCVVEALAIVSALGVICMTTACGDNTNGNQSTVESESSISRPDNDNMDGSYNNSVTEGNGNSGDSLLEDTGDVIGDVVDDAADGIENITNDITDSTGNGRSSINTR